MVSAISTRGTRSAWVIATSVAVAAAAFITAAPATAGPSSTAPGALSVKASALTADVLPGESTSVVVAVTNVGGSTLTGVELTESLPAALSYVPGSVVAVRTAASGSASTTYSAAAGGLSELSPGLLVSGYDGIDLAAGQTLRVSFRVTVSPARASGIDSLAATALATSGASAVASDSFSLNVLRQGLAVAYDGSN